MGDQGSITCLKIYSYLCFLKIRDTAYNEFSQLNTVMLTKPRPRNKTSRALRKLPLNSFW